MNAPAKGQLLAASIIYIIWGALVTLFSLIFIFAGGFLADMLSSMLGGLGALAGGIFVIVGIIFLLIGVFHLVTGIMGANKAKDPSKGGFFVGTGIALLVISVIYLVLILISSITAVPLIIALLGVLFSILYILGGSKNKKSLVPMQ